jgi:hypothetical protein
LCSSAEPNCAKALPCELGVPKSVEDDRKFLLVIGEYFPRAYDHFRAAVDLKSAVADKWRELLDSGFFI